jgi:hypothetical protein
MSEIFSFVPLPCWWVFCSMDSISRGADLLLPHRKQVASTNLGST